MTAIAADPTARLLTFADLYERWQPVGKDARARHRWVQRRMRDWGLRAMAGGRGADARFRLVDVLKAEARGAGEKQLRI